MKLLIIRIHFFNCLNIANAETFETRVTSVGSSIESNANERAISSSAVRWNADGGTTDRSKERHVNCR